MEEVATDEQAAPEAEIVPEEETATPRETAPDEETNAHENKAACKEEELNTEEVVSPEDEAATETACETNAAPEREVTCTGHKEEEQIDDVEAERAENEAFRQAAIAAEAEAEAKAVAERAEIEAADLKAEAEKDAADATTAAVKAKEMAKIPDWELNRGEAKGKRVQRYQDLMAEARDITDWSPFEVAKAIKVIKNRDGKTVILFAAGRLTEHLDLRQWLMYICLLTQSSVSEPFILVYQIDDNSGGGDELRKNRFEFVVNTVRKVLDKIYSKNLEQIILVDPSKVLEKFCKAIRALLSDEFFSKLCFHSDQDEMSLAIDLGLGPSQLQFLVEPSRHFCFQIHMEGDRSVWSLNSDDLKKQIANIMSIPCSALVCEISDATKDLMGDTFTLDVEVTPQPGTVIFVRNRINDMSMKLFYDDYPLDIEGKNVLKLVGKEETLEVLKGTDGHARTSVALPDWSGAYSIGCKIMIEPGPDFTGEMKSKEVAFKQELEKRWYGEGWSVSPGILSVEIGKADVDSYVDENKKRASFSATVELRIGTFDTAAERNVISIMSRKRLDALRQTVAEHNQNKDNWPASPVWAGISVLEIGEIIQRKRHTVMNAGLSTLQRWLRGCLAKKRVLAFRDMIKGAATASKLATFRFKLTLETPTLWKRPMLPPTLSALADDLGLSSTDAMNCTGQNVGKGSVVLSIAIEIPEEQGDSIKSGIVGLKTATDAAQQKQNLSPPTLHGLSILEVRVMYLNGLGEMGVDDMVQGTLEKTNAGMKRRADEFSKKMNATRKKVQEQEKINEEGDAGLMGGMMGDMMGGFSDVGGSLSDIGGGFFSLIPGVSNGNTENKTEDDTDENEKSSQSPGIMGGFMGGLSDVGGSLTDMGGSIFSVLPGVSNENDQQGAATSESETKQGKKSVQRSLESVQERLENETELMAERKMKIAGAKNAEFTTGFDDNGHQFVSKILKDPVTVTDPDQVKPDHDDLSITGTLFKNAAKDHNFSKTGELFESSDEEDEVPVQDWEAMHDAWKENQKNLATATLKEEEKYVEDWEAMHADWKTQNEDQSDESQ